MPFHLPFNSPYFLRPNYRYNYYCPPQYSSRDTIKEFKPNKPLDNTTKETKSEDSECRQSNLSNESSEYFFEVFGLKLYFDDVLLMCLLYFLYSEGVQDQELFLCLILLLLS